MKNKREIQKYFNSKYFNEAHNYNSIISKIECEEMVNKRPFIQIVATILIVLLSTAGITYAGVKIYKEYIEKQGEIKSDALYSTGDGGYSGDYSKDMSYDEKSLLNYKIIADIKDFSKYKEKLDELPDMSEEDFKNKFLIIIADIGANQPHKRDLFISEVTADETTTYINVKQKENPNYDKNKSMITLYAIVDRTLLRKEAKLNFEVNSEPIGNFKNIDELPKDYSVEDALRDGCFVVDEKGKILSDNVNAIDNLMEDAKNGKESFVRIYVSSVILDLKYEKSIFTLNVRNLGSEHIDTSSDRYTNSYKYLVKSYNAESNTYKYGGNNYLNRAIDAETIVEVSADPD